MSLVILLMGISCKDKPQPDKEVPAPEVEAIKSLPPEYKEIAAFMDLEVADSTQIETILNFKALMGKDSVIPSDASQNLRYYKNIMKNGTASSFPIFEMKDTNFTLILFKGKGYVGAIWAKVLIDKATGKTIKVRFGHKMESEGYGSGIVSSSFGDQFSDKQLLFEDNTFGLIQNGKEVIKGASMVDGVSGATITSSAVVEMLNEGLKNYEKYLAR